MRDEKERARESLDEAIRNVGPIHEHLAQSLRVFRAYHDLSQDEVAERAGLHRSHVGELERGEGNPRLTTVIRLAHAFNLRVHELVSGFDFPGLDGERPRLETWEEEDE